MPWDVRVLHGSSAALARALPALGAVEGIQASPSFLEGEDGESEMCFLTARVAAAANWDEAAARVRAALPGGVEFLLTTAE